MAKKQPKVVLELSRKDARLLARFLDAACPADWSDTGKLGDVAGDVFESITDQTGKTNWSKWEDRKTLREVQARFGGVL